MHLHVILFSRQGHVLQFVGTMVTLHKIVLVTGQFYFCGRDKEDERSMVADSSWRGRLQREPRA
jgi:hypothetical protein